MAGAFIGVANTARRIKSMYIGVNGIARKVKSEWIGAYDISIRSGQVNLFSGQNPPMYIVEPMDKKVKPL